MFTPICTRCHSGAGAPQGLQLDAGHSYALLVGVPSTEQPGVLRVKPGDPGDSYLVLKLEGAASISGVRMPFGGPYLPQSTIDVIRQWITAGAQPSATVAENANYMLENTEAVVALHDGVALYVELPTSVELLISHTDPGLQGDRSRRAPR